MSTVYTNNGGLIYENDDLVPVSRQVSSADGKHCREVPVRADRICEKIRKECSLLDPRWNLLYKLAEHSQTCPTQGIVECWAPVSDLYPARDANTVVQLIHELVNDKCLDFISDGETGKVGFLLNVERWGD